MKKLLVAGAIGIVIWLMIQFPHAMLSPGELVRGHQDLNNKCLSCHEPFWGINNNKCIGCHQLSEIGKEQLPADDASAADRKILFHHQLADHKCTMCHTDHKGAAPDAALTSFTHTLLPETTVNNCAGCHDRPSDELHAQLSTSCKNCHNMDGWKSDVHFDHSMIQQAALNNCASCHQKPTDAYHQLIKENCNICHTMSKWVPSTFDHSRYFYLDRNHNVQCNICHTNKNLAAYTCYGCHEHSESNLREEHNEEGIFRFNDCVSCHKSGSEQEMETNGRGGEESNRNQSRNTQGEEHEKRRNGHENEENDD